MPFLSIEPSKLLSLKAAFSGRLSVLVWNTIDALKSCQISLGLLYLIQNPIACLTGCRLYISAYHYIYIPDKKK